MNINYKFAVQPSGGYLITDAVTNKLIPGEKIKITFQPLDLKYSIDDSNSNEEASKVVRKLNFMVQNSISDDFKIMIEQDYVTNIFLGYENVNNYLLNAECVFYYIYCSYLQKYNLITSEVAKNILHDVRELETNRIYDWNIYIKVYKKYIQVANYKLKIAIEYNTTNTRAIEIVQFFKQNAQMSDKSFTYFDPTDIVVVTDADKNADKNTDKNTDKNADKNAPKNTEKEKKMKRRMDQFLFYFGIILSIILFILFVIWVVSTYNSKFLNIKGKH